MRKPPYRIKLKHVAACKNSAWPSHRSLCALQAAVAVRFCPVIFRNAPGEPEGDGPFALPYRMVYAGE